MYILYHQNYYNDLFNLIITPIQVFLWFLLLNYFSDSILTSVSIILILFVNGYYYVLDVIHGFQVSLWVIPLYIISYLITIKWAYSLTGLLVLYFVQIHLYIYLEGLEQINLMIFVIAPLFFTRAVKKIILNIIQQLY